MVSLRTGSPAQAGGAGNKGGEEYLGKDTPLSRQLQGGINSGVWQGS